MRDTPIKQRHGLDTENVLEVVEKPLATLSTTGRKIGIQGKNEGEKSKEEQEWMTGEKEEKEKKNRRRKASLNQIKLNLFCVFPVKSNIISMK